MSKKHFRRLLVASLFPFSLLGQGVQEARVSALTDLKGAVERLAELREKIEQEKIPISREVNRMEKEAHQKRNDLDRKLRLRDNRDSNLLQLEKEVLENERELESSLRLLKDYMRSWRQGTPPAEQELWGEKVAQTLRPREGQDKTPLVAHLDLLRLSAEILQEQMGGNSFTGDAIVPPEGMREKGRFWSLGPILLFNGDEGSSGFIEKSFFSEEFNSMDLSAETALQYEPSRLLQPSEFTSRLIAEALQSKTGELVSIPLDPSLGKAFVMEIGEVSLWEEIQKGGIWIFPILFSAALSLGIAFVKASQILSVPQPRSAPSLDAIFGGPFEILRKTAQSYKGKKPEILEEILYENIIDFQIKLEKGLPLIAVTAASAPLLGLLGTVTGMIDVFRQITNFANPENSELARGISEALVTTKFGLVTAIPSLIVHALLSRRLQGVISKLEGFAARLVHLKRGNLEKTTFDSKQDQRND